jgi:hypothetical protein
MKMKEIIKYCINIRTSISFASSFLLIFFLQKVINYPLNSFYIIWSFLLLIALSILLKELIIESVFEKISKLSTKLKKVNKWFLLAVISLIVLFYLYVANEYRKSFKPSFLDCLKLGSESARRTCILFYKPIK